MVGHDRRRHDKGNEATLYGNSGVMLIREQAGLLLARGVAWGEAEQPIDASILY